MTHRGPTQASQEAHKMPTRSHLVDLDEVHKRPTRHPQEAHRRALIGGPGGQESLSQSARARVLASFGRLRWKSKNSANFGWTSTEFEPISANLARTKRARFGGSVSPACGSTSTKVRPISAKFVHSRQIRADVARFWTSRSRADTEPTSANFASDLVDSKLIWPTSSQLLSKSSQTLPNSSQLRPNLPRSRPTPSKVGPNQAILAEFRTHSVETQPNLSLPGRNSVKLAPTLGESVRIWPKSGQLARCGRACAEFSKIPLRFGVVWANLVAFGPTLGNIQPDSCRTRG